MAESAAIYWPSADQLMALAASRWRRAYVSLLATFGLYLERRTPAEAIHSNVSNSRRIVSYDSRPVERRAVSPVAVQAIECR
jgi:hypothetical protein